MEVFARRTARSAMTGVFALVSGSLGVALLSGPAAANNGMMSFCHGAKSCGMGGAGIALPSDAANMALNPALIGRLDQSEVSLSAGWFHADRTLDAKGVLGNTTAGKQSSQVTDYPDGALAATYQLAPEWTLGAALFGAGGGEVKYAQSRVAAGFLPSGGNYDNAVRVRYVNLTPTISYAPNDWSSYGISAILGYQDFKSNMATAPNNAITSAKGQLDTTYGFGMRLGGSWDVSEMVSLGAFYASKVRYGRLHEYTDLFIGAIDQPPTYGAGLTLHPRPDTDISLDFKMLQWSAVPAINMLPQYGGFGWGDQNVVALGIQHRLTDDWTLRAGYNWGESPIPDHTTFANALFPAIVEHHFTAGASWDLLENLTLNGAGWLTAKSSQTDPGNGDSYSRNGAGTSISLQQYGAQVGVSWKF